MKKKLLAMLLIALMCLSGLPAMTAQAADTSYKSWLQTDSQWGSLKLGSSSYTVKSSGCLVTAIAMLVCHTGSADPSSFSPATLVNYLNKNGGFTAGGALYWQKVDGVVDGFYLDNWKISLSGMTKAEKIQTMRDLQDEGYGVIISVRNGGHWVALDRIEGSTVYMMDPGSSSTNLFATYDVSNVDRLATYKGKSAAGGSSGGSSGSSGGSSDTVIGTGKVNCSSLYVRSGAGTSNSVVTSISKNTTVSILGEAKDSSGTKWYKISVNGKTGYSCAQYITVGTSSGSDGSDSGSGSQQASGTGVVNCSVLNVRSGAGTSKDVVTTIARGQSVTITSTAKDSSGSQWYGVSFKKSGKSYSGYVSAQYITKSSDSGSSSGGSSGGDSSAASGQTMKVAYDAVNVRSGASTSKGIVTVVYKNDKVTVTGQDKDSSGSVWYKVTTASGKSGYIRSDLLTESGTSSGGSSSGGSSSGGGASTGETMKVAYDGVNLRSGAGITNRVIEVIYLEDTLTVLGQDTDSSGDTWYKVKAKSGNTGYIRSDMLKAASSSGGSNSGSSSSGDQGKTSGKVVGGWLNVRSGAGTSNKVLTVVPEGTKVTISESVKDGSGSTWYHVTLSYGGSNYDGYVSAQYIQ